MDSDEILIINDDGTVTKVPSNISTKKSNKLKLIILVLVVFLVSLGGLSYAYFTVNVEGNEEASSIRLTTAYLNLVYNDIQIASGINVKPGWATTKTLTVTNEGTDTVSYTIKWRDIVNEIANGELVISATCSSSSGTCDNIPETPVPTANTEITNAFVFGTVPIAVGVTHTYTVTVTFKETGSNQDYNQNKEFYGTLNIGDGTPTQSYCFTTSGTTNLTITEYTCNDTDIIIPSTINGKTVTAIGQGAFQNKGLTSVVIPNTVTSIGNQAFYTNQISSVTIPSSVTTLGEFSFAHNDITSINIPSNITTIKASSFKDNDLISITLPSTVTSIEAYAFQNNKLTSITIPSSVMTLGNQAFYDETSADRLITSVTIKGKTATSDFTSYGTNVFGWASGYSDSNITWN